MGIFNTVAGNTNLNVAANPYATSLTVSGPITASTFTVQKPKIWLVEYKVGIYYLGKEPLKKGVVATTNNVINPGASARARALNDSSALNYLELEEGISLQQAAMIAHAVEISQLLTKHDLTINDINVHFLEVKRIALKND